MQAAPSTPFKMAKYHLLLKVLIVALDAPAQLGEIDQAFEGHRFWNVREPVFDLFILALGPLDQQPFFRAAVGEIVIAMGDTYAYPSKAPGQRLTRTFAPRNRAPGLCRQAERELLDRDRPMLAITPYQLWRTSAARPLFRTQRRKTRRPHRGARLNAGDVS